MANTSTATIRGNFIEIVFAGDGADWWLANDMPDFSATGLRVKAIQFVPDAANAICHIRDYNATPAQTGPTVFYVKCADTTDQRRQYHDNGPLAGVQMWPSIDITDQTWTTPANCKLFIEIA